MPTQSPMQRARNFQEVELGYDETTAAAEAERCLHCKNQPCVSGCPMYITIPDLIAQIKEQNYEKAYQIITSRCLRQSVSAGEPV